jgi:hypothetical protein
MDGTDIVDDATVAWLLEGDPAVGWQVERDLLGLRFDVWARTRDQLATTGWVGDLLERQDDAGTWGGGIYGPKWISTTYTLLLLRRMGLDPANPCAEAGCVRLLDDADWCDGGVSYWSSRRLAELCVNGMVLSICAYFGIDDERVDSIAGLLVASRMPDGAWNCDDYRGATHSSFHTTISVLEGLHQWKVQRRTSVANDALASGTEFMLEHAMFRSHRTGDVINPVWTTAHFPPRWHYDVLRGLDHLQNVRWNHDERASDAIEIISAARRADGRWGKGSQYSGQMFFPLEPGRTAGRWNTLRAMRVLKWWHDE